MEYTLADVFGSVKMETMDNSIRKQHDYLCGIRNNKKVSVTCLF